MDFGLQDRVAIITGASYGIGRAIAESFIQEGVKVALCARNREQLDQAARELGSEVLAIQADMTRLADIEKLFAATAERFGRLDILVNNAGGTHLSQLLDLRMKPGRKILTPIFLACCAAPALPCHACASSGGAGLLTSRRSSASSRAGG